MPKSTAFFDLNQFKRCFICHLYEALVKRFVLTCLSFQIYLNLKLIQLLVVNSRWSIEHHITT